MLVKFWYLLLAARILFADKNVKPIEYFFKSISFETNYGILFYILVVHSAMLFLLILLSIILKGIENLI